RLLGGTALARAAAALARRGARLVLAEVADHRAAGGVVHFLVAGPPVAQSAGFLAGDFAQQQEVVAGAEARAFQQRVGALALAAWQAFLHVPDLADGQGEALGHGDASALLGDQLVGCFLQGRNGRQAAFLLFHHARRQRRPEQRGEQEGRGDRLADANALVGVDQRLADQLAGVFGVVLEGLGGGREQR